MPNAKFEEEIRTALKKTYRDHGQPEPDAATLECEKRLALLVIKDETTTSAIMAAQVIVLNVLNDGFVFTDIFRKCIADCLAGKECVLGLDFTDAGSGHGDGE